MSFKSSERNSFQGVLGEPFTFTPESLLKKRQLAGNLEEEGYLKSSKRPRTGDILRSSCGTLLELKWDHDFVFPTGDVVLIAKDTKFQVHSDMLSLPGSSFSERFQHRDEPGGENVPLAYTLDISAVHLRHFLWALYSPPYVVARALTLNNFELDRMLNISTVAERLGFAEMNTWVLDTVKDYFHSMDDNTFLSQAMARLERTLKRAEASRHCDLYNSLLNRWMVLLKGNLIHPKTAITFSDRCSLHHLRGLAYYYLLTKDETEWATLDARQLETFKAGRHRLQESWNEIRQQLLTLDAHMPHRCDSRLEEMPMWQDILAKADRTSNNDPFSKLKVLAAILENRAKKRQDSHCAYNCIEHALFVVHGFERQLKDNLGDFFVPNDPPPSKAS